MCLLLLLIFSPIAIAQRTPITNGNIKSAVSAWTTNSTTATTVYGDIASWNVAAVTSMADLFYNKPAFNADIGGRNTASVISMLYMFYFAQTFNQSIRGWNVASVSTMNSMFSGAAAFNADIGKWSVASVSTKRLAEWRATRRRRAAAGLVVLFVWLFVCLSDSARLVNPVRAGGANRAGGMPPAAVLTGRRARRARARVITALRSSPSSTPPSTARSVSVDGLYPPIVS